MQSRRRGAEEGGRGDGSGAEEGGRGEGSGADEGGRSLRIVQLNCGRGMAAMLDLAQQMAESKYDVALLQEPCAYDGKILGLPAQCRIYNSADFLSAIVVREPSIQVLHLPQHMGDIGVAAQLKGWFGEIIVVSIYCRFSQPIEPYLDLISTMIAGGRNVPLMVAMDANASSSLWHSKGGSLVSIGRGELLEDVIMGFDLMVLNKPSRHYSFSGPAGQSDVDVTLGNDALDRRFELDWRLEGALSVSDHNAIVIGIKAKRRTNERYIPQQNHKWSIRGTDRRSYVAELAIGFRTPLTGSTATEMAMDATTRLTTVNNRLLKAIVPNRAAPRVGWWSYELRCMRAVARAARLRIQRAMARNDHAIATLKSEHRRLAGLYKRKLREAKQQHTITFTQESMNRDPWGAAYKLCRGKAEAGEVSALRSGQTMTTCWAESTKLLLGTFFPADANATAPPVGVPNVGEPYTIAEVGLAFQKNRSGSAPGLDGLTADMWKYMWKAAPEPIVELLEACRSEGVFPVQWKQAKVLVFRKSADKDPAEPTSYRPISLLPVIAKTLERLMVARLLSMTEIQWCAAQFGFTMGLGTDDALTKAKSIVDSSSAKYVLAISCDFKGAFDNLRWGPVLEKLRTVGCPDVSLWHSYFSERRACIIGKAETVWSSVSRGCPQGSICGPTIWNFMMDDLLWELERSGCRMVAYADDLLLLVEGKSRLELEQRGKQYIEMVCRWGNLVGVALSETKTAMMLVKGHLSRDRPPNIQLNGRPISTVMRFDYLGVTISGKFNFQEHFVRMRKKLVVLAGTLTRLFRRNCGIAKRSTLRLYKGLFVPCAMHGASVWAGSMQFAYARKLIQRCQRGIMRCLISVCRTVSTEAMQVILGELPWDLLAEIHRISYKIRRNQPLIEGDYLTNEEVANARPNAWKSLLEEKMMDLWQTRWDASDKGRTTYRWLPNVRFARDHPRFNPSLELGYLLTGHGSMNAFLQKRGIERSAACSCGDQSEDWCHILADCPLYADLRNLQAMGVTRDSTGAANVENALSNEEQYDALCTFAKNVFDRRKQAMRPAANTP